MTLTGEQRKQLHSALCAAFPERPALAQMVRFGLDVPLPSITEAGNLSDAVFALIEWAAAQGRLKELITAAVTANPANPELRVFAVILIPEGTTSPPDLSPSGRGAAVSHESAPTSSGGIVNSGQMGNVNTGSGLQTNIGTIQTTGGAVAVGPQSTVYDHRQTTITQVLPAPALSPQEQQNRQRMIARVRATWISGVLEKSLDAQLWIELGLQTAPDAVRNPWQLVLETFETPGRSLPVGTSLTQVFDSAPNGLLILGAPGAGKTILLLSLARDLLDRAERDPSLPIPAVFHLSTWVTKRLSLIEWLVGELLEKYNVPRTVGQAWVSGDRLLLLLDGLDEVARDQRAACVAAINTYRQQHGLVQMAVCSREEEYRALATPLGVQTAVLIQPLTGVQIDAYLEKDGATLATLRSALHDDHELRTLAETPLLLNVLALAYQGVPSGTDIPHTQRQIFAAYVHRMLARRQTTVRYSSQQTQQWLGWLAHRMVAYNQTVFYIERLQPSWMPKLTRRFYKLAINVFMLLLIITITSLGMWLNGWISLLITGTTLGILGRILVIGYYRIEPVEIAIWSWRGIGRTLSVSLVRRVFMASLFSRFLKYSALPLVGFDYARAIGTISLIAFLLSALPNEILTVARSTDRLANDNRIHPNQGIWQSAKNGLPVALCVGLIGGLLSGLLVAVDLGQAIAVDTVILIGVVTGLIAWLVSGGWACLQHITLRFLLSCSGAIPWNYVHFLDSATERILLRKVGGGYIFIHRLLLEYFAGLDSQ